MINVIVLYRYKNDLILFDFNYKDVYGDEIDNLIVFHFEERHDFEERLRLAKCIFSNHFNNNSSNEDIEYLDYEIVK